VGLATFSGLAGGEAGSVTFLFLDSPDNIDLFDPDDPDPMFNGNLLDFSECHVRSPFIYADKKFCPL
jgi:hypothetical protein